MCWEESKNVFLWLCDTFEEYIAKLRAAVIEIDVAVYIAQNFQVFLSADYVGGFYIS